jgi:hypothetical protein
MRYRRLTRSEGWHKESVRYEIPAHDFCFAAVPIACLGQEQFGDLSFLHELEKEGFHAEMERRYK